MPAFETPKHSFSKPSLAKEVFSGQSFPEELNSTLYRPEFEKDNCGFGLIAHMDGASSHWLVETAIEALARLTHRGAISADGKTGDGCGLLSLQRITQLVLFS